MRKAILAIIAGLLLCAQSPISSFPPGTFANRSGLYGGTAAGYTGPGDVFNTGQTGFYSCARAYNAAYAAATGNMCDVVITSTGTAACTIKAATTGFADLAGTYCAASTNLATACAAGCSVTKVYNQVNPGTCDQIQATLASMPLLLLSSTPTGTLPAIPIPT